jgi:outer membrane lipoprotein-sorting protein
MNKKIASLSLVVLSSIFLAGCTKKGPEATQTQSPAKTMSEASEFAKAIESGKPTICSMTKGEDKMEYLIKGKKMRMNTATSDSVGHMINDENFMYVWDDKTGQGSKMAIPTEEEAKKMEQDAQKYADQLPKSPKLENEADFKDLTDDGYTVTCQAGSVDDSVFIPPTNVKFIDPTEMMKALPSPDAAGNIDMSKLEELSKQYGAPTEEGR